MENIAPLTHTERNTFYDVVEVMLGKFAEFDDSIK